MLSRLHRIRNDQDGFGLILVIGVTAFVTVLIVTASVVAVHGLKQSQNRTKFEQSLASAENGIDATLAHLQKAFDDYNADYPVPSLGTPAEPTPACSAAEVAQPAPFATQAAEDTWARTQLATLPSSCWQTGASGDYLVLKPATPLVNGAYPKYGKVYALGMSPSHTDPGAVTRMVKAEYVFMPFRPTHAVLTGGDLNISASTTVTAAYGVDPALAAVHTNGSVRSVLGNPSVSGPVTSTGDSSGQGSNRFASNPGGSVSSKPPQSIPKVNARTMYYLASGVPGGTANWFDLCTDGTARPWSASGPCQGTSIGSSPVRGWSYDAGAHLWTATKDALSGTYYVDGADVTSGNGVKTFTNLTVIAASTNPGDCATKQYGNINWTRYDILAPSYPNVWFYADADIATGSNFSAGSGISAPPVVSGMFIAGDQISLQTSSSGAVGSVLAGSACTTSPLVTINEVKNPAIYYDPNSTAPFTSIITTTLWLEY